MLKAVIDTNIFVSALLNNGSPRGIIRAFKKRLFQISLSRPILDELTFVLGRSKFRPFIIPTERDELLKMIKTRAAMVHPQKKIVACRDPKDNKILEAAIAAKADFVISSDKDLLTLHPFEGVSIITPREFLKILNK